jgi:PleD family two-component response regulator
MVLRGVVYQKVVLELKILRDDIGQKQDAIHVAGRIQKELILPFEIEGRQIALSCSMGIAVVSPEYQRPEDLMAEPDGALYQAKSKGRGRQEIYSPR